MHKIMVVDDEVVITLQLEERLTKRGYEVVGSASSGEEAVEMARRLRPDLILMDIVMPGKLDGIEAAELLKAEMDISVIFLTAYANEKIVKRAKSVEPLGYIVKPFRETELQAMIEVALYKKEMERKLQASELRYRTLFESCPIGVGLATKEGEILECNDVMLQMTGYSEVELLQVNLRDTYQNPEEHALLLKRLQTDGCVHDFEVELKRKDGTPYYASLTITPLTLDGEEILLTVALDITERKLANHERRSLLKELEVKNTELERFAYTVSHDLKSPLISIQGFAELLREDLKRDEKEKVESDLEYIKTAATKMERLMNDTLQLSRIGRVVNPPEDVPFGEIAQEALEQAVAEIKSSGVDVSVVEDLPTVHVDRMRIVEVLVNLITNSINYMDEQSQPKIEIGLRTDGEKTVFFVKDNGIGIEKSQHEKVFELFYKEDESSKGTGAGLAIVKRIIEVHNGRIWIESDKGKGCTVCFTLPLS